MPEPLSIARRLAESPAVKLLFVGDVVGGIGRRTLAALLPGLREELRPDFVVVNGENAAGGVGITEKTARELLELGADAITLGNHAYRHREVYGFLDREERIVRPANYPKGSPGHGHTVVEQGGERLGVINLSGQVFLTAVRSPFAEADALLAELRGPRHPRARRHARRGDEREGRDGLAPGRPGDRLPGHPHARADGRRARAARRHRLRDRRRHDRRPRRSDRRQARAGARALHDAHERALRDHGRGPLAERAC